MRTLLALILSSAACCAGPMGFNRPQVSYGFDGWWRLDATNSNGTVTDYGGLANTGTLSNSPAITGGVIGNSLNFNGSSQLVTTTLTNTGSTAMTVACWVLFNSVASRSDFIHKWEDNGGSTHNYGWLLSNIGTPLKLTFYTSTNSAGTGATPVFSGLQPATNTWYHVVGVFNDGVQQIYTNGVLAATVTPAIARAIYVSTNAVRFGGANTGGANTYANFHNGRLDDVRIYNRALSAAEVMQLYGGGWGQ